MEKYYNEGSPLISRVTIEAKALRTKELETSVQLEKGVKSSDRGVVISSVRGVVIREEGDSIRMALNS